MKLFDKSKMVLTSSKTLVFRVPSQPSIDSGKVRLGGLGPAFRKASIEDKGNVRLGGLGPIFRS